MVYLKSLIRYLLLIAFISFVSCAGTLGSFDNIRFPTSKEKLEYAIDSLFSNYPEYKIPKKWQIHNDWSQRGFDFLDSRIFYFNDNPEEMYYVTFIGTNQTFLDSTKIDIAIRAVYSPERNNWLLEEDFERPEKERIQSRFKDNIISLLELYTGTISTEL